MDDKKTFSGKWDTTSDDFAVGETFVLPDPATRHAEIRPRGTRWPWYAVYEGDAYVNSTARSDGTAGVVADFSLVWVTGSPKKTRLGLRRWFTARVQGRKDQ